jgi:hypothetical protein
MKLFLKSECYSKRMKRIYLILLLPLMFISGCKDAVPDAREFPIIVTNSPIEVDETGATFQGELVTEGKVPATYFGFVWGINDQIVESSNRIILNENPASGKFSIRIDHSLAKDVEYKIRAFATSGDITVYGNTVSFISKGSNQNGWMVVNPSANISTPFYSCSDNESGYIIYQSSKMDRFDPTTEKFLSTANYPFIIYDNDNVTSAVSGNVLYFLINGSNLYKFANGVWSPISRFNSQFQQLFRGYYQSLSVDNKIYFLSSQESFAYDLNSDTWQTKARLPIETGISTAGTTINGKAYVVTSDKNLWEYDPATDKWVIKTQYPGNLGDRLATFSYNGKLYFGISYLRQQTSMLLVDKRLWIYNLGSNNWNTVEEFPTDHTYGGLFYFFLKNNLYVGMGNKGVSNSYTLWKYDPSKNN